MRIKMKLNMNHNRIIMMDISITHSKNIDLSFINK